MDNLQKLAFIIDKVRTIQAEMDSTADEIGESIGSDSFDKDQSEMFEPVIDAMREAIKDIGFQLIQFQTTFDKVAAGQQFVIGRYCIWTKIDESKASGRYTIGNHRRTEVFNPNTIVYRIPSF